jgi:hypothetical protein
VTFLWTYSWPLLWTEIRIHSTHTHKYQMIIIYRQIAWLLP